MCNAGWARIPKIMGITKKSQSFWVLFSISTTCGIWVSPYLILLYHLCCANFHMSNTRKNIFLEKKLHAMSMFLQFPLLLATYMKSCQNFRSSRYPLLKGHVCHRLNIVFQFLHVWKFIWIAYVISEHVSLWCKYNLCFDLTVVCIFRSSIIQSYCFSCLCIRKFA